ncbi:MAG: transposase [Candidatus Eisenbacteria sp.]|nr:transposase [Candidatus Eisenbacteria bacterium]
MVVGLLEIIQLQQEQIQAFKDEIARLKGEKSRPKIKPSKLEPGNGNKDEGKKDKDKGKRPGSAKRSKKAELEIHETVVLKAEGVPSGSEFKGYEDYTVQGIVLEAHNVLYRRERWKTPEGEMVAPLPLQIQSLDGGHFDHSLNGFVLYQYHHAHVTQPLLLEQLRELGIDISAGQINRIITEGHDGFHDEKDEILCAGLETSGYVNVDDTGARHKGKNGYCTHIGNEWFAWFQSTRSKSRINFLELLRAGHETYVLNAEAIGYMRANKLPKVQLELLADNDQERFANQKEWMAALATRGITKKRHIRIATEGALLGSVLEHGINPEIVIVSDDAGQFNVLLHSLCWVHAERLINKLVGFNDEQRKALEATRTQIWDFYQELKAYRKSPSPSRSAVLGARFDEIFTTQTCFATLNQALGRLHNNKSELLLVLERPDIPLHNNLSEGDIREYVKRRKISGGTRSELGRRCRDTFASLKKTCRKLGISFWKFINDRLRGTGVIASLSELIRQRSAETRPP